MDNSTELKLLDIKIKIKNLTKELARAIHQKSCLEKLSNKAYDYKLYPNNCVMYSKADLLKNIMFLFLPKPLLEIISDYTYQNAYEFLYNCYESVYNCDNHCFEIINNYSIEVCYGDCYVVDIFTNELVDKYCFYECSCDCQYEYVHRKNYKLVVDSGQNKVHLLEDDELILIIIINNNNCTFVPIDTAKEQEENKINDTNNNNSIIEEIITNTDFKLLPNQKAIFGSNNSSFFVAGQKITVGFCIKSKINSLLTNKCMIRPFILEYDLVGKQIINCYEVKDINETNISGFKFMFDNEFVHILPRFYTYQNKIYTYKKIVV